MLRSVRRARRPFVALVALVLALVVGYAIKAVTDNGHGKRTHVATVALSALPPQAARTIRLIQHGGPFPYPRTDGAVFHNDAHRLPAEPDGYYHEYTVPAPGSPGRGARRVVTGAHGEFWYTGDGYQTVERVDLGR